MKISKLFLLCFLIISFSSINADEIIKTENSTINPDTESPGIDLESIKKSIKPQKQTSVKKKKIPGKPAANLKSGSKKNKTTKKAGGIKKKKVSKNIKSGEAAPLKDIKNVKTEIKDDIKKDAKEKEILSDIKTDILSGKSAIETEKPVEIKDEKKGETASVINQSLKSDTVYINPSDRSSSRNRLYIMKYSEIADWGKPYELFPYEDAAPVIDGFAFYMPDFRSEFAVDNYDRELIYKLVIDFVKYKGKEKHLNSLLKIWGRDLYGRMHLIAEVNQHVLSERKLFEILIPYELSYPGRFDIIIREYSDIPGKWGIWDMIVTARKIEQIEFQKPDISEKMKDSGLKIFK